MYTLRHNSGYTLGLYNGIWELPIKHLVVFRNYWERTAVEFIPRTLPPPTPIETATAESKQRRALVELKLQLPGDVQHAELVRPEIVSPSELAFTTLVQTLDDMRLLLLDEADRYDFLSLLRTTGIPPHVLQAETASSSERLINELATAFPNVCQQMATDVQIYQQRQRRMLAECARHLTGETLPVQSPQQLHEALVDLLTPAPWGAEFAEAAQELREQVLQQLCDRLQGVGVQKPAELPVYAFVTQCLVTL
ncbi:hypothetical protein [Hymenobacter profundi]|uniref:Uncharacterized protein n=1 Tax=Hymenobacter profundi TaxID=1982110 RepID=A0ABS6WZ24_9BACT|nr:hypothetical protein [Hymenobacter profundi]MBW3128851.1 hypothetical protein [Hymenobacter profundi]